MDAKKLLLKPTEVAESLGICRSKTYDLIGRGILPSILIGGSVRVPSDELMAWVRAQARETAGR